MSKKRIMLLISIAIIIMIVAVGAGLVYMKIKNRNFGENAAINSQNTSAVMRLSDQQKKELQKDIEEIERKIKLQPDDEDTRKQQVREINEVMRKYNLQ